MARFAAHTCCSPLPLWFLSPRHKLTHKRTHATAPTHQRPPLYLDPPHQRCAGAAVGVGHRHLRPGGCRCVHVFSRAGF